MANRGRRAEFGAGILTSQKGSVETADVYFKRMAEWLDLEAEAERARLARRRQIRNQRDVERTGEALIRLDLIDHKIGLGGRYLLDFAKPAEAPLPMNRLKVGAPVVVSDDDDPSDEGVPGVVSRRRPSTIQVATERWPEGRRFRLDLSPDETTRQRQLAAMGRAETAGGRTGRLRDILLGQRPFEFDEQRDVEFFTRLNPPQEEAVRFAMAARDIAILHGPPGTGKTTTLAELIYQAVRQGQRVLACAPSNTAVDNILERLVAMMPNVLRVGHPARVFESLRGHTLDELVETDPSAAIIADMRREVDELTRAANRRGRGRDAARERSELFAEAGRLRGQIRSLERSIVRSVVDSADVICTTTTIDDDLLGQQQFDLVVVDEACQSTEPSIWQAALRGDKIVFAGDHCQLPPTVLSDVAAKAGMRRSLMQRLVEREGEHIYRRLTVQYRMHNDIMDFSSEHFYDGTLVADASVQGHRLADLSHVEATPLTTCPLTLIDTAGAEYEEELEPDGESKRNPREAHLVTQFVRELTDAGLNPEEIGIIAPYAAQVRLLRNRLDFAGLEIDTVDGFQGREKEAIVLTMVRSNQIGEIGFLADTRRTNVALTRARRKLIVIGDSATLGHHDFYSSMFSYFELHGAYRSVWEFE
ncbi:AAA domain-containing protein [Planctomycetaceae bacterium SH139]